MNKNLQKEMFSRCLHATGFIKDNNNSEYPKNWECYKLKRF